MANEKNRYAKIIERIFFTHKVEGAGKVSFRREDIEHIARALKIELPKNLGDVVYSLRYRASLLPSILAKAPSGQEWMLRSTGHSSHAFVATKLTAIVPATVLAETKIRDATPGVIAKHAHNDGHALLARLRYHCLIDVFTGVTCYSLQSHVRTSVPQVGQVRSDEIYIGLDRQCAHYVFSAQAKSGKDKLGVVQIEQDFAIYAVKLPVRVCRPIAVPFMNDRVIAMYEFEKTEHGPVLMAERHDRLVPPGEMTLADRDNYRRRSL